MLNFKKDDFVLYEGITCIFIEKRGLKSLINFMGKPTNVWNHELRNVIVLEKEEKKEEKRIEVDLGLSDVELDMEDDFLSRMGKNYYGFYQDNYDNLI